METVVCEYKEQHRVLPAGGNGKFKKHFKRKIDGSPFVMIERSTFERETFKNLTVTEFYVYVLIKSRFNGFNDGEISLPYSTMSNLAPATVSKALKGLEHKGWIIKTRAGGLYKQTSLYKLTGHYDKIIRPKQR